jgi:hypothetical protein
MYDNKENAVMASNAGMLGVRETIANRLDRQIAEVEAHLSNLKLARQLLKDQPVLEEFHNALTRIGF